jgi:FkbM family methyltransferase
MGMTATELANRIARRLGVEVRRSNWNDHNSRRARVLRHHEITVAIDVGANTGQYARRLRTSGYEGRLISFEPVSDPFRRLQSACAGDPRWECYRVALSDEAATRRIHVGEASVLSSFLGKRASEETPLDVEYAGNEEVTVLRLDDLAADLISPTDHALLKLDVQGYEARVLNGARTLLPNVELIECELSLVAMYEDQPTFRFMIEMLDDLGYRPIGFTSNYADPATGYLADVDGLFVRC